jgi:acyl carrier protein
MTSSLTALVGPATQAAYVGGNAFQDAFARFRLSQNLPATSLQIGLILEVGATVNSVGLQQSFQRSVTYGMSETEFLQLVEGALCHTGDFASTNSYLSKLDPGSLAQLATGFEPSRYVSSCREGRLTDLVWCDNPRFASIVQAIIDRAQSENTGGSSIVGADSSIAKKLELASSLAEKEEVARLAFIDRLAELFTISAGDIDPERPMAHYGLDSMVTTELRTWLIKTFGVDVNPLHLLSKTTRIADLVKTLVS